MNMKRFGVLAVSLALALAFALTAAGLVANATPAQAATKKACTGVQNRSGVNAKQVIEIKVTGTSTAKMYRCTKDSNGRYYQSAGAKKAAIGYNGAVAGSKKREGDGKTPKGVYTMRDGFGSAKKKGLSGREYTHVTKKKQWVWVDGSKKKYNTMQRYSDGYRGEDLRDTTAYKYAQVIGYNEARTWQRGSAIFLHKMPTSGKTAGCVALKEKDLVNTLKWEKKSKVQIAIH